MSSNKGSEYSNKDYPQTLAVWDWTNHNNAHPLLEVAVPGGRQHHLAVSQSQPYELATNGLSDVFFYTLSPDLTAITVHTPQYAAKDFNLAPFTFTTSAFIAATGEAATATAHGHVVVWSNHSLSNLAQKQPFGKRAATKCVKYPLPNKDCTPPQ